MGVKRWRRYIFRAPRFGVRFNVILIIGEPLRMVQQLNWSGRERSSQGCIDTVPKSGSPPSLDAASTSHIRCKSGTLD